MKYIVVNREFLKYGLLDEFIKEDDNNAKELIKSVINNNKIKSFGFAPKSLYGNWIEVCVDNRIKVLKIVNSK